MRITKLKVAGDHTEVSWEETKGAGDVEASLKTDQPPHPDLVLLWGRAVPHVLSLLSLQQDNAFPWRLSSVRFLWKGDMMAASFTLTRKIPVHHTPTLINSQVFRAKPDGTGLPEALHQILNRMAAEGVAVVKEGKSAQETLALVEA